MPISLNDLAAFSEQDVADVLADELADRIGLGDERLAC